MSESRTVVKLLLFASLFLAIPSGLFWATAICSPPMGEPDGCRNLDTSTCLAVPGCTLAGGVCSGTTTASCGSPPLRDYQYYCEAFACHWTIVTTSCLGNTCGEGYPACCSDYPVCVNSTDDVVCNSNADCDPAYRPCDLATHRCKIISECNLCIPSWNTITSCTDTLQCCPGLTCNPSTNRCEAVCGTATQACTGSGQGTCCAGLECFSLTCRTPPPNLAPAKPPAPILAPPTLYPAGAVNCVGNCPPSPLPPDPEGDPVTMTYQWYKSAIPAGGWTGAIAFDCAANGCIAGDSITARSRACDNRNACNESDLSPASTVISPPPPPLGPSGYNAYIILAIVAAISVLALAYMASYVFGIPPLRAIVQDELLQVLATGAVALALVGANGFADNYLLGVLEGGSNTTYSGINTAMDAANTRLGSLASATEGVINNFGDVSKDIGAEASRGVFCNFLGVGFTLVNCSPLNAFRGSFTSSAFAATVALADTYAQMFLLSLARSYAFTFLLPIGLFLRCFKASRGAGGALIAIGFGFYTIYPTVVLATDTLLHGGPPPGPAGILNYNSITGASCDPNEPDVGESLRQFNQYASYLVEFGHNENLTYFVLVRVLFLSILNLIITLGFIRELAHIIGSEIDVTALARIS